MKNRFIPFLILCILLYGCSKAPIAEFEAMETSVSACDTIIFADLSSNTPTSWLWDFGDGGSSTEQNPNYNYSDEGIYSVSLTATNEAGDSPPEIKTDYIEVSGNGCPKAPVADFEALGTSVSACDTIIFTDLSLNTPTSWLWDFGDGESSTEQNPIHTYTDEGFYSISLTATNEVGESPSEIKTDYIEVSGNCVTDLEGNIYKAVTTMESLGDHLNLSMSQLYRKVRAVTGSTPNEMLRMLRMKRAAQLFTGEMNITEVMYEVGLQSNSHFAVSFKKYYGMNPSEYRKHLAK